MRMMAAFARRTCRSSTDDHRGGITHTPNEPLPLRELFRNKPDFPCLETLLEIAQRGALGPISTGGCSVQEGLCYGNNRSLGPHHDAVRRKSETT